MNTNLKLHRSGSAAWISATRFRENDTNHIRSAQAEILELTPLYTDNVFDIHTAIQRAQAGKLAAETANKAKSDFLADMSHEIRTPLGAIVGLTSVLLSTQLDSRQRQCLTMLQGSAEALMTMLKDLLDIGKIESGTIQLEHVPFNMNAVLSQIVSIMSVKAEEKGISLDLLGTPSLSETFFGDSGRIRQIVLNLVGNAIKFTETGGVTVACAADENRNGKKQVSISVTDSGIGIPPDKINVIFERFVQADRSIAREYGGTGLGLSISKALAEKMGGNINVASVMGKGSTFTLCVPL